MQFSLNNTLFCTTKSKYKLRLETPVMPTKNNLSEYTEPHSAQNDLHNKTIDNKHPHFK